MAATNRLTVMLTTYGGVAVRVAVCVAAAVIDPSGAVVGALRTALGTITRAMSYRASIKKKGTNADTPTNAAYEDVKDKMELRFKDPNGNLHRYKIPSPKPTCFLAENRNVVDSAETNVAALIAHFLAYVKTRGGDPLQTYVGGSRVRAKKRKRT